MANKVTIELDMAVVQKAVNAKVQPAVEKILASVDLPSRIATALLAKPKSSRGDPYSIGLHQMMMYGGYGDSRAPIEGLIDTAINEAAQAFIKKAVAADRNKIEAAFKKMLAESPSRLAKTLLASLENSLANEWTFTLDTKMSAKERDRYYD